MGRSSSGTTTTEPYWLAMAEQHSGRRELAERHGHGEGPLVDRRLPFLRARGKPVERIQPRQAALRRDHQRAFRLVAGGRHP
jgi:hypothetical protein